jgi:hypothetical protein
MKGITTKRKSGELLRSSSPVVLEILATVGHFKDRRSTNVPLGYHNISFSLKEKATAFFFFFVSGEYLQ